MNFQNNPICVHKDLKDQIKRAVPFLEVYNREQIMETGQKYRDEIMKIKNSLLKQSHLGTYMGDRLIEEAENDPNIKLSESPMKSDGEEDTDSANPSASYGQSKLNQLFSMMHKSQKRTDEVINDFERNFGLRLQKLTDNQIGIGLSADYKQIAKEL